MDAVFADRPSEFSPADLRAARNRIAELEAELRQLRAQQSVAAPPPFGHMRLSEVEACLVSQAMTRAQGNVSHAARALGLSRAALYRRLERHALDRESRRRPPLG
jgi:transcriptional regulator of acetoin/glycerol metabolism